VSADGLGRREFLLAGAASILPSVRANRAPAKSYIRLQLTGGPSHLDSFDPKPDAPLEIRGPFRAIRTSVPDILISELFPRTARQAHRFALIRSVYTTADPVHSKPLPGNVRMEAGPDGFRRACLAACRAIEAGETDVAVNMFESVLDGPTWDTHGWGPFTTMRELRDTVAPMFDVAYSALLENLDARGLLDTTVVVATGEFGRTPKLNPDGGRDHWPHCWTALIAGGGIRGGQIYGSSDATGSEPRDNPVTPEMIEATVNRALGRTDSRPAIPRLLD
jgi:uncharacterized protein (DUF1501 family)